MLAELLTLNLFHFLLVFVRLAAAVSFLPGFSAGYVPILSRLVLTLFLALVSLPMIAPSLPPLPTSAATLVQLIVFETLIGLFIAMMIQALLAALNIAAAQISLASGLMNAMVFDPISAQQAAMVQSFIDLVALIVVFATGLHHQFFEALIDSYILFTPGQPLMLGDMANHLARVVTEGFWVGLRLASPFLLFIVVFNVAAGLMNRMMPQMNVFFVALPVQILITLGMLMVALPALVLGALDHLQAGVADLGRRP